MVYCFSLIYRTVMSNSVQCVCAQKPPTLVFTKSTRSLYSAMCWSSFCRASSVRITGPDPRDIPCYKTSARLCASMRYLYRLTLAMVAVAVALGLAASSGCSLGEILPHYASRPSPTLSLEEGWSRVLTTLTSPMPHRS
jgi:hypothetical protein